MNKSTKILFSVVVCIAIVALFVAWQRGQAVIKAQRACIALQHDFERATMSLAIVQTHANALSAEQIEPSTPFQERRPIGFQVGQESNESTEA